MTAVKSTNRVKFIDEHMENFEHEVGKQFKYTFLNLIRFWIFLELSTSSQATEQERSFENNAR